MNSRTRTAQIVLTALVVLTVTVSMAGAQQSSPLTVEVDAGDSAEAGSTTTVSVAITNDGPETKPAIADVALPDGWSITNRSDDGGAWNGDETKWLFQGISAGDTVSPSLQIAVPDNASGEYQIAVQGSTSETNTTATATIAVGAGESMDNSTGGSNATEQQNGAENGSSSDSVTPSVSGPGFGALAALVAVIAAALVAIRRE